MLRSGTVAGAVNSYCCFTVPLPCTKKRIVWLPEAALLAAASGATLAERCFFEAMLNAR